MIGTSWRLWLRWLLLFVLLLAVSYVLLRNGMFQNVWSVDWTKISFIIYGLFFAGTLTAGWSALQVSRGKWEYDAVTRRINFLWFLADQLLTLGMIGTVLGFIFMLNGVFSSGIESVAQIQSVLGKMTSGMAVALYTTASGLICSLLLKTQVMDLEQRIVCGE